MSAVSAALNSRRAVRAFPWLAGMILAAGVVVFALTFFRNTSNVAPIDRAPGPPVRSVDQRTVPLAPTITQLARRFLHAAVGGENPTVAYRISGPSIRQGMTLAQWKHDWATVGVPIVPFPIDKVAASPFRTDLSYQKEAVLEVALVPKKGSGVASQVFFIGFGKFGKRWLVTYWGPHSPIPSHDAR